MITLDENATSYEPAPNRFQYQRHAAAAPEAQAPGTVGAAPGQHVDNADAAALPGLNFGGFGSRTTIGGIPRSAIPGLSASTLAPPPSAGAPAGGPHGAGAGPLRRTLQGARG